MCDRRRNWCFTLNNYTENQCKFINELECAYCVYGFEFTEQKVPHLQGYIEFTKAKTFNTMKKLIPEWHVEGRRGNAKDASNYCKKGEQPHKEWEKYKEKGANFGKNAKFNERGVLSTDRQGARKDLDYVRETALDEGMRVVTSLYNCQQIRVAEKFLVYNDKKRDWHEGPCNVVVIWGESGTGKSQGVREYLEKRDIYYYVKNTSTKWWDGYDGEETVIIDEFRDTWWELDYFLGLVDKYEFRVEYKGGTRQMRARNFYITTDLEPGSWFVGQRPGKQVVRRITKVFKNRIEE